LALELDDVSRRWLVAQRCLSALTPSALISLSNLTINYDINYDDVSGSLLDKAMIERKIIFALDAVGCRCLRLPLPPHAFDAVDCHYRQLSPHLCPTGIHTFGNK
jgi:hypothetical protein